MAARTALLRFPVDTDHLTPRFVGVLRAFSRRTFKTLLDPYRPELYYMRGPGPRWRAKHGQPRSTSTSGA